MVSRGGRQTHMLLLPWRQHQPTCMFKAHWQEFASSTWRKLLLQVDMIKSMGGEAQSIKCDLTSYVDQKDAFENHIKAYNTLDFAILNAGVPEQGELAVSLAFCFWRPESHANPPSSLGQGKRRRLVSSVPHVPSFAHKPHHHLASLCLHHVTDFVEQLSWTGGTNTQWPRSRAPCLRRHQLH